MSAPVIATPAASPDRLGPAVAEFFRHASPRLLIAFVQAATQLQEQTLQYVAKFFAIVITIFITASLLGGGLYQFGDRVFSEFAGMVRR